MAARISCCSKPARIRATSRPACWPSSACARELGRRIPVMVSGTIETMGTMLAGQTADALYASIAHADLLSIGLNCGTGPEFMTDHLRTLQRDGLHARFLLSQRGLAERGRRVPRDAADRSPRSWSASSSNGWLNMVGGCCGTTAAHIKMRRADGRGQAAARAEAFRASRLLFRHRPGGGRRQQPPADRGRAHQRDRLAPVQEPDRRREVGRSHRDRAAAR